MTRVAARSPEGRRFRSFVLAAGSIALLVVSSVLSVALPATPAGAQEAAPADPALTDLGTCVSERNELSVLFLIDQSGSLQDTDPDANRVVAVKAGLVALGVLEQLTDADGEPPEVEVRFAGFDKGYQTYGDWVAIEGRQTLEFLGAAAAAFADRDDGIDTDYVTALEGARATLGDRVAERTTDGGDGPCQMLLWFTDGKFDIEDRTSSGAASEHGSTKDWAPDIRLDESGGGARAVERGVQVLCDGTGDADPVVDEIADDGIAFVTLALTSAIEAGDQEFLRDLTGAGGGGCGRPERQGAYVPATDLNDLILAFVSPITQLPPGARPLPPGQFQPCSGAATPTCQYTFDVDPGLKSFNLLVVADQPGLEVELRAPSGANQPLLLEQGADRQADYLGASLNWTWIDERVLSLNAQLLGAPERWQGEWSASFLDQAGRVTQVDAQVVLFGNLVTEVPEDLEFTLAETAEIPIAVVAEEGTPPTPPELIDRLDVTARVRGQARERLAVTQEAPDSFEAVYEPPADLAARTVPLELGLTVHTTSGLVIGPRVQRVDVPVRVPEIFPSIEQTELRPASITGSGATTAEITAVGSTIADGCVSVDGLALATQPGGVDGVEVGTDPEASSDSCLEVPAGETRTFDVEFQPTGSGRGAVEGALGLTLSSDRSDETVPVEVNTRFQMDKPPNQTERGAWFIGLLLLGVALPLLLLWLLKWLAAQFEPPGRFQILELPVSVVPDGHITREDGQPFALSGRDFDEVLPGGRDDREREFAWRDLRFFTSAGGSPFEPPKGWVARAGGDAGYLASGSVRWSTAAFRRGGEAAEVPLELRGTWVLFVPAEEIARRRSAELVGSDGGAVAVDREAPPAFSGTLYAVIAYDVDPAGEARDLADAVVQQAPEGLSSILAAVPEPPAPPPPPPEPPGGWDSGPDPDPGWDSSPSTGWDSSPSTGWDTSGSERSGDGGATPGVSESDAPDF